MGSDPKALVGRDIGNQYHYHAYPAKVQNKKVKCNKMRQVFAFIKNNKAPQTSCLKGFIFFERKTGF